MPFHSHRKTESDGLHQRDRFSTLLRKKIAHTTSSSTMSCCARHLDRPEPSMTLISHPCGCPEPGAWRSPVTMAISGTLRSSQTVQRPRPETNTLPGRGWDRAS